MPKFLEWALDWKGRQHVYLSSFVSHFGLSDRESASQHFQKLIQSTQIDQKRRRKLQKSYNYFKEHSEEQFWSKHSLRLNTKLSAQKLARAAQDTAVDEAEAAYEAIQSIGGEADDRKEAATITFSETSAPSKSSAPNAALEVEEGDEDTPSWKPVHKRVTILEADFLSESGTDYTYSGQSSTRSSLTSIDFLLIDHLVGPGTTSSRLTTNKRMKFNQIDVSLLLMDERRSLIKKQSEIKDVSDLFPIPMLSCGEMKMICDCAAFAATHSFPDTKRHVQDKIRTEGENLAATILHHYTERPSLWRQSTSYPTPSSLLAQNEDTYTQGVVRNIILGIVGDLEVVDHWSRDPLPTPRGFEELYFPDYFADFDSLPLFVVEIKKPD
ncbi:hypothetical protein EDD11_007037, partial [Mortierella claussenii]